MDDKDKELDELVNKLLKDQKIVPMSKEVSDKNTEEAIKKVNKKYFNED